MKLYEISLLLGYPSIYPGSANKGNPLHGKSPADRLMISGICIPFKVSTGGSSQMLKTQILSNE
jgi:hypothetical protein